MDKIDTISKAIEHFKSHHGILTTSTALELGIHPRTLYKMRDEGLITQLSRALYQLTDSPIPDHLDLVTVSLKIPNGVICLISALAFHELTTQIPRQVDVACIQGARRPSLDYPPTRIFWYAPKFFNFHIQEHLVDGIKTKIYSPEKTIIDCFRYRKRIGLDVAIEALKSFWQSRRGQVDLLMECASACRIKTVIQPYLEAIINE